MKLSIKNIGKIESADIELNGVTVITGENNTGKSTISKTLFCTINSLYQIDDKIKVERQDAIQSSFISWLINSYGNSQPLSESSYAFATEVTSNPEIYKNDRTLIINMLKDYAHADHYDEDSLLSVSKRIIDLLSVSNDEIIKTLIKNEFQNEFNMQINNVNIPNAPSEIYIRIKDKETRIQITNDEQIESSINAYPPSNAIYIDDPYSIDGLRPRRLNDAILNGPHRAQLRRFLLHNKNGQPTNNVIEEIIMNKRLNGVTALLNSVCSGDIVEKTSREFSYKEKESNASISVSNLSAGLKSFLIIKTLLLNGWLEENGTLILDEPEIHLHPEWQIILAELIVLLQKEFNMHILLTTHSPYFLDAIETYSQKHNISDKCKYYLSVNSGKSIIFDDITDNIERAYAKLAKPFQDLENTRYSYD